ncbi:hypothetical protein CBS147353_11251 [Aspergillus niger]|nr:hypothetical protein CBS147353_11251 [Aspergillus niger]
MCCRLSGNDPDTCDPTGLCLTSGGEYYREFCTDQSWNSTNCLPKDICGNKNSGNSDWTYQLTSCGEGLWCCGSSTSCCNTHETFSLGPAPVGSAPNSSVTATSAPTTTVTIIPTEDSSKNKGESERLTKVAIGVAVGVPLACIAVGMFGAGYILGIRSTQKILSPAKFEPRAMSIPLEKPKGEIGRPRRSNDAAST